MKGKGGMGHACPPRVLTSRTTSTAATSSVTSAGATAFRVSASAASTATLAMPVGCGDGGSDVSDASAGGAAGRSVKPLLLWWPADNASREGWLVNEG